jgi:hypothetical protein
VFVVAVVVAVDEHLQLQVVLVATVVAVVVAAAVVVVAVVSIPFLVPIVGTIHHWVLMVHQH